MKPLEYYLIIRFFLQKGLFRLFIYFSGVIFMKFVRVNLIAFVWRTENSHIISNIMKNLHKNGNIKTRVWN